MLETDPRPRTRSMSPWSVYRIQQWRAQCKGGSRSWESRISYSRSPGKDRGSRIEGLSIEGFPQAVCLSASGAWEAPTTKNRRPATIEAPAQSPGQPATTPDHTKSQHLFFSLASPPGDQSTRANLQGPR